jgi:hypothetical protein
MTNKHVNPIRGWGELFPEGRWVFYEGEDPDGFAAEMVAKFGFDPRKCVTPASAKTGGVAVVRDNDLWGADNDPDEDEPEFRSYQFFIPGEHMDAVYGNHDYPLGS